MELNIPTLKLSYTISLMGEVAIYYVQTINWFSCPYRGTTDLTAQYTGSPPGLSAPIWGEEALRQLAQHVGVTAEWVPTAILQATWCCNSGSKNWYKVLHLLKNVLTILEHYKTQFQENLLGQNAGHTGIFFLGELGLWQHLLSHPRPQEAFYHLMLAERYYTFLQEGLEPLLNLFRGILQFFLFSVADLPHFPFSISSVPSINVSSSLCGH